VTIILKDSYPNFPPQARWISEKLIFIRVWWGRIVGSDLIFDVEKREFVYREMIHDGTHLYRQSRRSPGRKDTR